MDPSSALILALPIISVADAFDALTTDRPYRKGLSYESALAKLKRESIGTQFDPEVINNFLTMMQDELVEMRKRKARNDDLFSDNDEKINMLNL